MDLKVPGATVLNLGQKNVLLGKNGCGKSHLLKALDANLTNATTYGLIRYISPERAGQLAYQAGVEDALTNQENWLRDTRRKNQAGNFKQQSFSLFRRLENAFLRKLQNDHTKPDYEPRHFNSVITKINALLDRVEIRTDSRRGFTIHDRATGTPAEGDGISSGESELISLAIEFLSFQQECEGSKQNFLLIDEPDVHLHPDLQHRLATFITSELSGNHITLILATHSTSLLSALVDIGDTHVAFMRRGDTSVRFHNASVVTRRVLPIFGAHPLSNVFNTAPILLVEGEDDERIWQQVVRSSQGAIKVYPCITDTVAQMNNYEKEADGIIQSVYDNARGYSLRDRDGTPDPIDSLGAITRMRLGCRSAENLFLSDDVLALAQTDWPTLSLRISECADNNPSHQYHQELAHFISEGLDRKSADLKEIRNILVGLVTKKPWEVLVGQAIARLKTGDGLEGEHSLKNYLGAEVCEHIIKLPITLTSC